MFAKKIIPTKLFVGLGNPGAAYRNTRHNAGFRALDLLAQELGIKLKSAQFHGLVGYGSCAGEDVALLKPNTMMNLSGASVAACAKAYRIPPEHILVFYDDISFPPGTFRYRERGSAGGHNGIKSLIACLQTEGFPRIKLGVGAKPDPDLDLADWVLSDLSPSEAVLLDEAIRDALQTHIFSKK